MKTNTKKPRARKLLRGARILGIAVLVLTVTNCVMHYLMPHAHPPAASEFGMGPRRSVQGIYVATLDADEELEVRKLHTVRLAIADSAGKPVDGAVIAVDGGMPAHGHGLPTQPRVTRTLGEGRYQVDGVRFNMGGWWVLTFRVDGSVGPDSVTFNLDI